MASAKVRHAVQRYRTSVLRRYDLEEYEAESQYALHRLNDDEMHDYVKLTIEVDVAENLAQSAIHANPRWVRSTRRNEMRSRINKAGDDSDRVDLKTN
jgi:hypothetical protein